MSGAESTHLKRWWRHSRVSPLSEILIEAAVGSPIVCPCVTAMMSDWLLGLCSEFLDAVSGLEFLMKGLLIRLGKWLLKIPWNLPCITQWHGWDRLATNLWLEVILHSAKCLSNDDLDQFGKIQSQLVRNVTREMYSLQLISKGVMSISSLLAMAKTNNWIMNKAEDEQKHLKSNLYFPIYFMNYFNNK